MDLRSIEDPFTTLFYGHKIITNDADQQDGLLDTYNELLRYNIKTEKAKKKALESLEEKEHELSEFKETFEEKKSLINSYQSDIANKCGTIHKRDSNL